MNRNLYYLAFAILLMLSVSCDENKESEIPCIDLEANVDNWQQVNMSSFISDIRYVVLERIPENELSHIGDIDFSGEKILVSDKHICLLYDMNGHFLTKIGNKGRGPGEYPSLSNIQLGDDNHIYIRSLYDLFIYSADGKILSKYRNTFLINNEYVDSWCLVNDSLFLGHIPNSTGQKEHRALLFNKEGVVKEHYKNYFKFNRLKEVSSGFEGFACFNSFNGDLTYTELYNDTIFSLSDNYKLIPLYFFNPGKWGEPRNYRETAKPGDAGNGNFIHHWRVFQSSKYLFIEFNFGKHFPARRITPDYYFNGKEKWNNSAFVLALYNKEDRSLVLCKPTSTDNYLFTTGMYNDIDAGPRFLAQKQINDSTMVMWVQAQQLKAHVASDDFKNMVPKYPEKKKELEELANSLKDTDNPVLMIVRLRKDI